MKKIRKTKGMMLLARLYYNFECKTCLIYKPASKIPEALVHFPPSPLSMLRCDFKVTWLKQHCKKGGKTTWSKKTSASRFLNEFMGLRFMYLARSYFALNSLHLLQNCQSVVYSERCSYNLLRERYHPFAFLCPH